MRGGWGGLESRCVDLVYGADGAVHHPHRKHFCGRNGLSPAQVQEA